MAFTSSARFCLLIISLKTACNPKLLPTSCIRDPQPVSTNISHHLLMHSFISIISAVRLWSCSLHIGYIKRSNHRMLQHSTQKLQHSMYKHANPKGFVPLHTHTHIQKRTHKKWNTSTARSGHLSWGWWNKKKKRFKGEAYFKILCRMVRGRSSSNRSFVWRVGDKGF